MNWEHLTSPDFAQAVKDCDGVCLLPIGVIEKHGDHLPLGQDTIYIHSVCSKAAEIESAIVFPFYYFGQILEGKHVPGTIALNGDLQLKLLENMCDEIGRNGLKKIILVNGHGGNNNLLPYFCQLMLDHEKDYITLLSGFPPDTEEIAGMMEADEDGHAGEGETCTMMSLRPELVKTERFAKYGRALKRMEPFSKAGLYTGVSWYADYPGHLAAGPAPFTAEKGNKLIAHHADFIAKQIRLVKDNSTPTELYKEFHVRAKRPENRYP